MPKKSRKPEKFVRTPGYPGGRAALGEFIKSELKYPKEAMAKGIQGMVTVSFVLNEAGRVVESGILQGLGYGCDEEALRITRLLKFKAVNNRGVRATFKKTLKIPFKLKKQPPKSNIQINYSFKESEKPGSSSMNYTIQTTKKKPG